MRVHIIILQIGLGFRTVGKQRSSSMPASHLPHMQYRMFMVAILGGVLPKTLMLACTTPSIDDMPLQGSKLAADIKVFGGGSAAHGKVETACLHQRTNSKTATLIPTPSILYPLRISRTTAEH